MIVDIRLFATMKDKVGQPRIQVEVAEPATVKELLEAISVQFPTLDSSIETVLVSVNKAFASEDTAVNPGDEVAMFPPVSGGSDALPYPDLLSQLPKLQSTLKRFIKR